MASGRGHTVATVDEAGRSSLPRSRTYVDPTIGAELQRLQAGAGSELVVDGRVVLAETSVKISRALGPLAVDAWLAMNAVWVEDGLGADGRCSASMRRVARLVWPRTPTSGGKTNRLLRQVFDRLYEFSLTAEDFDMVSGTLRAGALSKARLITELTYDRDLRLGEGSVPYDPSASGMATGGLRDQSLSWRFSERYVEHARDGGLLALDLDRLSALDGAAKTLWVQMSTPRFPFRAVDGDREIETCSIELTTGNLCALGVSSPNPKQQRRTLRAAGQRIVQADRGYVEIDCDVRANVLVIARRADYTTPMIFPDGQIPEQLPRGTKAFTPDGLRQADEALQLF